MRERLRFVRNWAASARCSTNETRQDIPAAFLRYYPAYKTGQLNVSELVRVCDLSRTTVYNILGFWKHEKQGAVCGTLSFKIRILITAIKLNNPS